MDGHRQVVLLLLLVALAVQGTLAGTKATCSNRTTISEELHIDIFTELLSNHTDQAEKLQTAPLVGNMDPKAPAYEFKGVGVHLTDRFLSDTIRVHSCLANEITMFGSVFFKDGNSAGPLIELSYADSFGPSLPVFSLRLDALADEIIVAYRHLGNLHTEVFKARLHNGKWRRYGVTLSGNQALVYDECQLVHQRVVPLPDYCANDSSLIISVADSAFQENQQLPGTGFFAFLQNVGIHFGQNGIQKLCPNVPEACVSCGRFLKLVQRVYHLNQEVEQLNKRVAELENKDLVCSTAGAQCSHTVNGQTIVFASGTFRSFSEDQTVCYCSDASLECTNSSDLCLNGSVVEPPTSPSTVTPTIDPGMAHGGLTTELPTIPILCPTSRNIPGLRLGEMFTNLQDGDCSVYTCTEGPIGPRRTRDVYHCSDYPECSRDFTEIQRTVATCCSRCSECFFKTCGTNSHCETSALISQATNQAVCVCDDGFIEDRISKSCVDVDECSEDPSRCPGNSVCSNNNGSFQCTCNTGFNMVISTSGEMTCEDDNECETVDCGSAVCENTPGSYRCICPGGTATDTGSCDAICATPCQNGGTCVHGDVCHCHNGYDGTSCEADINECDVDSNACPHQRSVCINTMGGFFCRCEAGYVGDGTTCEDMDECSLKSDYCLDEATCINIPGSFQCLCKRGQLCTGSCSFNYKRQTIDLANKESTIVSNCRNCTCLDGVVSCVKTQCSCSTNPPRDCCPQCYRKDCVVGSVRIRPGQTWVNPSNRCERTFCSEQDGTLVPVVTDLSDNCPPFDCPANLTIQPMGKCCPTCLLQPCTMDNNKQSVSFRNGCETCVCENSQWTCKQRMKCPSADCEPEHILFSEDGCCPVCARQALKNVMCETFP